MAVTITKNLDGQFLGKSPLVIGVNTTNHIETVEVRPYVALIFSGSPSAGQTFTLEIVADGIYLTLTAVAANATPGRDEFRIKDVAQTLLEWFEDTLIPDIAASEVFSSFFTIEYDAVVKITLRESGSFTAFNNLSNVTFTPFTTDTDEAWRANYKLRLDVFVESVYRSNSFSLVNTLALAPDADGDAEFDIAESVRAYLGVDIPPLDLESFKVRICTEMQKRVWTRAYEYYGDNPQAYYNNTTYLYGFVFKGGVPNDLFDAQYDLRTGNDATKRRFLTWLRSHEKTVRVNDYEWLYFRYDDDSTFHKVKRVVYFADGTTTTDYVVLTASGSSGFADVERGDILMIATGYTQQDLATVSGLNSGKTISKYTFQLVNSSNAAICEAFTYRVEYRHNNDYRKTFVFQNGWGACETLHTVQAVERTLGVDKELAEVATPHDFDYGKPAVLDVNVEAGKAFRVNTGEYPEAYILHLEELLRSHGFTGVIDDGRIKPVVLVPGSFDLGKEDDDMFTLGFSYRYSRREDNYGTEEVSDFVADESGS